MKIEGKNVYKVGEEVELKTGWNTGNERLGRNEWQPVTGERQGELRCRLGYDSGRRE